jgi:hypothetical protein
MSIHFPGQPLYEYDKFLIFTKNVKLLDHSYQIYNIYISAGVFGTITTDYNGNKLYYISYDGGKIPEKYKDKKYYVFNTYDEANLYLRKQKLDKLMKISTNDKIKTFISRSRLYVSELFLHHFKGYLQK